MTLQNFILEQDINEASVDDILLEQAIAEFEVAAAILECYQKEEILLEYASSDVSEFSVFTEADNSTSTKTDSDSKKDNFVKNKAKAVGKFFAKMIDMFVKAVKNFINVAFVQVDFEKIANKIDEKFDDDTVFKISLLPFERVEWSAEYLTRLATNRMQNRGQVKLEEIKRLYDNYQKAGTHAVSKQSVTKAELVKNLKKLTYSKKNFDEFKHWKKNVVHEADFTNDDNQLPKPVQDMYTKFYRELTNDYADAAKLVKKFVKMASTDAEADAKSKSKSGGYSTEVVDFENKYPPKPEFDYDKMIAHGASVPEGAQAYQYEQYEEE